MIPKSRRLYGKDRAAKQSARDREQFNLKQSWASSGMFVAPMFVCCAMEIRLERRSAQNHRALRSAGENRMRRLIFGMIIGSVVAAGAAAAAIYYFERPNVLRVAVPRDSYDQAIMAAAALDFAKDQADIRLKLIPVENLAELVAPARGRPCRSRDRAHRYRHAAKRPDRFDHAPERSRGVCAGTKRAACHRRSARA